MSAAPKPHQSDIDAFGYYGLRMGADDFLALGQSRERYELINGVVSMSPRPSGLHQRLLSLIQFQLELHIQRTPGVRYFPDVDLVLNDKTVYAPDLIAFRAGRLASIPAKFNIPPDLIVEILSYGTKAYDLTTKREDYERFGVAEYWTYDPADGRLRCARRHGDEFLDAPTITGDTFECIALPGFTLDLRPLRAAAEA